MVGGNALGVDRVVFKHGVHYERFDGCGRKIQSEENCHLNDDTRFTFTRQNTLFP